MLLGHSPRGQTGAYAPGTALTALTTVAELAALAGWVGNYDNNNLNLSTYSFLYIIGKNNGMHNIHIYICI